MCMFFQTTEILYIIGRGSPVMAAGASKQGQSLKEEGRKIRVHYLRKDQDYKVSCTKSLHSSATSNIFEHMQQL